MILYADTSALVKLYVEEVESDRVRRLVEAANSVHTARVSYVEARAAFARRNREGGLTTRERRGVVRNLDAEWNHFGVVELTGALARRAAALAERRALRGYGAIQLASALTLRDAGAPVEFACFDERLNAAARAERLALANP